MIYNELYSAIVRVSDPIYSSLSIYVVRATPAFKGLSAIYDLLHPIDRYREL